MFNVFGKSGEEGNASADPAPNGRARSSRGTGSGGTNSNAKSSLSSFPTSASDSKTSSGSAKTDKQSQRFAPFFGQAEESSTGNLSYLAARDHWKGRFHELQRSLHQWMVLSMLLAVALIVSVSVASYLSVTSRVQPYVVAVDSERGDILRAGQMERLEKPSDAIMRKEVEEFIRGLRTVYTDRRATYESYQRMGSRLRGSSEASSFLTNLFSSDNPNGEKPPLALVGEMQRYISEIRVSKISGTRSWSIRWVEVTNRPDSQAESTTYEGTASVITTSSSSRDEVRANPFGTQVDGLTFEQV